MKLLPKDKKYRIKMCNRGFPGITKQKKKPNQ